MSTRGPAVPAFVWAHTKPSNLKETIEPLEKNLVLDTEAPQRGSRGTTNKPSTVSRATLIDTTVYCRQDGDKDSGVYTGVEDKQDTNTSPHSPSDTS
ncbi:UNVERIFIED_CONTAM: hypothetical protein Sangu_2041800 [Sesamum angustifolium]|uniref:Uncharacterized protein n=1 Tax=Sesamum angustifolium TaxID=2727405 RepID=A0AAW2LIJ5_9LAMI